MLDRLVALVLILVLLPVFLVLSLLIVIFDGWPFWYVQKRHGKDRKVFKMWKFRTMINGADEMKLKFRNKNEVDGPVFKIKEDPRFNRLGKKLSHTGIDELPQLLNILKGEMAFVGPRPLPIEEGDKIPKLYWTRYRTKPGIISPWIVGGYHEVGFNRWMESDVWYVKNKSFWLDLKLCWLAVGVVYKMVINELKTN